MGDRPRRSVLARRSFLARRSVLGAVGAAAVAGVAGCLDGARTTFGRDPRVSDHLRWHESLEGRSVGLEVHAGALYAATSSHAYRLASDDGATVWSVLLDPGEPDDVVDSFALAVGDGHVVVSGSGDGYGTRSLSPADGAEQWRVRTRVRWPSVAGRTLYTGGSAVTAFDLADGTERWQALAAELGYSPITATEETVLVEGPEAVVYALDAADGTTQWRTDLGLVRREPRRDGESRRDASRSGYTMVPVRAGETVYSGGSYPDADSGELVALDVADGTERWRVTTGPVSTSGPPAVTEDVVVAATRTGGLVAHRRSDGRRRWTFDAGGDDVSWPAVSRGGDAVFVGSSDGFLYAVDVGDGSQRWRVKLARRRVVDVPRPTALPGNDTVYAATSEAVFALETST